MLVNIWGAGFLDDFSLRFVILTGFISKRSCCDLVIRFSIIGYSKCLFVKFSEKILPNPFQQGTPLLSFNPLKNQLPNKYCIHEGRGLAYFP